LIFLIFYGILYIENKKGEKEMESYLILGADITKEWRLYGENEHFLHAAEVDFESGHNFFILHDEVFDKHIAGYIVSEVDEDSFGTFSFDDLEDIAPGSCKMMAIQEQFKKLEPWVSLTAPFRFYHWVKED
jgi:hypothetical protein